VNLFATGRAVHLTYVEGRPTEPYQIWWAGAIGLVEIALAAWLLKTRPRIGGPAWLVFGACALVFAMAEELTCWWFRTGIFRHAGEVPAWVLFSVASGLLWMCALSGFLVYRLFDLRWHHALLLYGFSGFLLEAFPFQKLYRHVPLPILIGLFPPAVAWHYVLIGLVPFLLVKGEVEARRRWDHPVKWVLGLLVPLALPTLIVLTLLS
jgi:hypothetical protein